MAVRLAEPLVGVRDGHGVAGKRYHLSAGSDVEVVQRCLLEISDGRAWIRCIATGHGEDSTAEQSGDYARRPAGDGAAHGGGGAVE